MRYLKLLTPLALSAFALFVSQVAPARAAVDMFLKLDGIKGESQDETHKDQIEILSYSWGVSRPPATASSFNDISITKAIDAASPKLVEATIRGNHIPKALITLRAIRGRALVEFKHLVLEDVTLTGILIGLSQPGDSENITLHYGRIGVEYFTIQGERTEFAWNVKENKPGGVTFPGRENPDADNDGLPDEWERLYGLNAELDDAALDFDGDGATNIEEFTAGTNPAVKNEVFRCVLQYVPGARAATLSWSSVPGKFYQILSSGELGVPFQPGQIVPAAAEGNTTSLSVPAGALNQFFRVQVAIPQ